MRTSARAIAIAFAVGACFAPFGALAVYDSGSTGADGAFSPTVNTTVTLPPSGIFNFTTVNIPVGVTVKFARNTTNTPVVILASGNVTVAGTIDIRGATAPSVGPAGGGALGDDGVPGVGGPGGFDGGRGGIGSTAVTSTGGSFPANKAGGGLGPGGGVGGFSFIFVWQCITGRTEIKGGTGGGFASAAAGINRTYTCNSGNSYVQQPIPGGAAYGSSALLPLIGGSGGGGGGGGESGNGAGGGGGGGAILIASSGTVNIAGAILADGGTGGSTSLNSPTFGGAGGGGAGGAIRIVATTIAGNGTLSANAGGAGGINDGNCCSSDSATAGAPGRIRLEAENLTRVAASSPTHSFLNPPGPVFVAGTPTLRIASVAGVSAPAVPTGNADITLPATTPNPVTVVFETNGVPVGNIVQLTVTPANGDRVTAITPALTGSTASATASVAVNLPSGPSTLMAQTTYTVVAAVGDLLQNFAGNERVEKVTLMATLGGPSKVKLITVSGKEYEAPAHVLRVAGLGG